MIRGTRLVGLLKTKAPKLVAAAFGMDPHAALIHLAGHAAAPGVCPIVERRPVPENPLVISLAMPQTLMYFRDPWRSAQGTLDRRRGTRMALLRLDWVLSGQGWAHCIVSDRHAEAEVTASYITAAPEEFLTALTRLVVGETECRAQFEAEPTAFRWIFYREGTNVWIRLLELAHGSAHDNTGSEIWSTRQDIDVVARAVIRCFDEVVREYGESP
ncbi:hypothetical protein EDD90_10334 [Streptomyces sp. Ag109_O5-1]|uniref:hypothetical protein n=1 Tax=Streptomyces sp. Ag109_O5-1 TaxID=1938851 RepID=UPI000FBADE24|nr:hypothetical protein [Streptomyces sp. Ag109_O5-1]RPE46937.1 hypothetical protein EDD90_10334 [Streptomyces sp. Ag109_O5-1]